MSEQRVRVSRALALIGPATGIAAVLVSVVALFVSIYTWRSERDVDLRVDLWPQFVYRSPPDNSLRARHCYYQLIVRNPTSFAVQVAEVWLGFTWPRVPSDFFLVANAVPAAGPRLQARIEAHSALVWKFSRSSETMPETHLRGHVTEASTREQFVSQPIGDLTPPCPRIRSRTVATNVQSEKRR